jgi:hypothetical protein
MRRRKAAANKPDIEPPMMTARRVLRAADGGFIVMFRRL